MLRQSVLCVSNGKLVAKLPVSYKKEEHKIQVGNKLPTSFESSTEGASSTDVSGFRLPPQIFKGWSFYLKVDWLGWTNVAALAGVEHLIKLHGGEIIHQANEICMHTVVVAFDRFDIGVSWENGRRVYTQFVIFEHIEHRRVMTRATLDNVVLREAVPEPEDRVQPNNIDEMEDHEIADLSDEGMSEA